MPPEEGRRSDEEGDPAVARDHPTRRREEDPVDGPEPRWAARPLEHSELVTEDEDLEVLGSVVSATLATADEETGEGPDEELEEGPHRPIVPGLSDRESGFSTPTRPRRRSARSFRPGRPGNGHSAVQIVVSGANAAHANQK